MVTLNLYGTVVDFCQVEPKMSVSPTVLTAALDTIGFSSSCIATSTTEEAPLEEAGVNAVWAIAAALGGFLLNVYEVPYPLS